MLVWVSVFFFMTVVFVKDASVVQAAVQYENALGFVVGYDEQEQVVFVSSAFAGISNDTVYVYTRLYEENAAAVVFQSGMGRVYELTDHNNRSNHNLTEWSMDYTDSMEGDNSFLHYGILTQNSSAVIVYHAQSGDSTTIKTAEVVLKELDGILLQVEGIPNEVDYFPAPIINPDGTQCVGIAIGRSSSDEEVVVISETSDEEFFYGQDSGSDESSGGSDENSGSSDESSGGSDENSGGSNESSGGSDESSSSGEDSDSSENSGNREDSSNGEDSDSDSQGIQGFFKENAVIVLAGAIVIAAVLVFAAKKKNQNQTCGQTGEIRQEHAKPPESAQQRHVGPTEPLQREQTASPDNVYKEPKPQFYLAAYGGCMDGKRYPVGRSEITIGRYKSNVISYPEGTPGVSRTHAKLYFENNRLMLMDCNSSSGTYVKGMGKLQPMHPVEVKYGDIFYIGEKRNSFEIKR